MSGGRQQMQTRDHPHRFAAAQVHLGDTPLCHDLLQSGLSSPKGIEVGTAMVGKGWLRSSSTPSIGVGCSSAGISFHVSLQIRQAGGQS